jgi:hypothetical protein
MQYNNIAENKRRFKELGLLDNLNSFGNDSTPSKGSRTWIQGRYAEDTDDSEYLLEVEEHVQ